MTLPSPWTYFVVHSKRLFPGSILYRQTMILAGDELMHSKTEQVKNPPELSGTAFRRWTTIQSRRPQSGLYDDRSTSIQATSEWTLWWWQANTDKKSKANRNQTKKGKAATPWRFVLVEPNNSWSPFKITHKQEKYTHILGLHGSHWC